MLKKGYVFALLLVLLFSAVSVYADTTATADTAVTQETAGAYLHSIGLYKGYEDGSLGLERPITRAEFATLIVRMLDQEEASRQPVDTDFTDVKASHWGSGYIQTAVRYNIVLGYVDNTFKPEGKITYAEAVTMIVRLLGYESSVTEPWPQGHLAVAASLGITKDLPYEANHVVNRGDVAIVIMQSMNIELR